MKTAINAFLICLFLVALDGCRHLDKAGVYQGDSYLYSSELAISTGYDVIKAFVTWEQKNRAALKNLPEITKAADVMRAKAPSWFDSAHALHDAYQANPTGENLTALETVLVLIRGAIAEAGGYMVKAASTP